MKPLLRRYLLTAAAALCGFGALTAREVVDTVVVRPVNSAYMAEGGSAHLIDTYLSPLHYSGWNVALSYERLQAMKFSPERWRQQLIVGGTAARAKNASGNSTIAYYNVKASWAMLHRWRLPHSLQVAVGPAIGANIGGMVNARNGNNPADAVVDLDLDVTAYATWQFRIKRLPVMLRWQSTLALTGLTMRQQYDELYYEISLGNRRGLIHGFWPGNLLRFNNLLTADLDVSNTRLLVGVRSDLLTSHINNLTTRAIVWSAVVGATVDWMSLSGRSASLPSPDNTRIVKAY